MCSQDVSRLPHLARTVTVCRSNRGAPSPSSAPPDTTESYTVAYSYDTQGRLTTAEYTSSKGFSYQYDAAGNVTGVEPVKVLPVELATFEGVADGPDVVLSWKTTTETNNAGFEVQHKEARERGGTGEWETLTFVEGAGTTGKPQSYEHRATGLARGTHLFRLKQVDLDGSATFSKEIEVALGVPDRFALGGAYPNPAEARATIPFDVSRRAHVRMVLYDVLGRRVATLVDGKRPPGRHLVRLEAGRLASGLYFYRIQMGSFRATKKLVVR